MSRLSDSALRRLGRILAIGAMTLAVSALVIYLAIGEAGKMYEDWALHNILTTVSVGVVMLLALPSQQRNGAIWAAIVAMTFGSLQTIGAATGLAIEGFSNGDIQGLRVSVAPSEINPFAAVAFQTALWAWIPSMFTFMTFFVLRAPNGELPSRRWRWVEFATVLALVVAVSSFFVPTGPWSDTPYNVSFAESETGVGGAALGTLALLALASLTGLIVKYRRSSGEERLQLRWFLFGLGTLVIGLLTLFISYDLWRFVGLLLTINVVAAFGVAITKYRLYDIDLVISRTVVYGSLAVFIGAVYVAFVVGIGQLIGAGDEPNAGLAIAATAIVAVAFQPLRRRLERVANRLVYGRRATPYEVLSEFSRRVAATDESLLDDAARSLVDGTSAEHAAVWVTVGDRLVKTAEWPEGNGGASDEVTPLPISQDGVELGVLTLGTARGQRLPDEDHRLATEVASGMGLALRNQVLTESLQTRVEELRESRRRLVAVQDETRRKLERDLHDGAQQQLVALKVKLGLARAIAHKDGATDTAALLEALAGDADEAVDAMRDFARGVYPPLLEAEGLGSAIAAQARRAPLPVTVESDGLGRYSREVEATVYFCVLEALQNTAKYANASSATVGLHQDNGALRFAVSDDGDGFDPTSTGRGAGLTNMEDRLDATGGSLTVVSAEGEGTTIRGAIAAARLEETPS